MHTDNQSQSINGSHPYNPANNMGGISMNLSQQALLNNASLVQQPLSTNTSFSVGKFGWNIFLLCEQHDLHDQCWNIFYMFHNVLEKYEKMQYL